MAFEDLLSKYADVAVRVGVGLEDGDTLLIRSSVEAVDFTRLLVEKAYEAGATSVDVLWSDDAVGRARFSHGSPAAAETVSSASHFMMRAFELGDLVLTVDAKDPDALAGQDVAKIRSYQHANGRFLEPVSAAFGKLERNWSVVAAPTRSWATKVFPDAEPDEAVDQLWGAIFRACRIDVADPVAAWRDHLASLDAHRTHLTGLGLTGLRYRGPGTDLVLGLPKNTLWQGGSVGTPEGRGFAPNLPTEEVFASPHRLVAEGVVTATKPLSLYGNLVEGFSFELKQGRIVAVEAERGRDVLEHLIATDEGSARFGEAAMVPMSSAVAAERLVWNNTLYDENDGCHIAVGRAYPICVEGGGDMSPDRLADAGLNHSTVHVDFVVGSDRLDVFGLGADGIEHPIIAGGEWAFTV